jgi:putative transcriptional regulator
LSARTKLVALRLGPEIAKLRRVTGLSQPRFAAALGISLGTLQGWEQGRRRPTGPALALLQLVVEHPAWVFGDDA